MDWKEFAAQGGTWEEFVDSTMTDYMGPDWENDPKHEAEPGLSREEFLAGIPAELIETAKDCEGADRIEGIIGDYYEYAAGIKEYWSDGDFDWVEMLADRLKTLIVYHYVVQFSGEQLVQMLNLLCLPRAPFPGSSGLPFCSPTITIHPHIELTQDELVDRWNRGLCKTTRIFKTHGYQIVKSERIGVAWELEQTEPALEGRAK